ncbi:MAG: DUF3810 domain-containing protein [Eggerthellaceae bacterium]|nr:DUF3810 domain-containing protein [Eggerthellaceae bacterium]
MAAARANPDVIEALFSRGVYPWLSSAVALVPSLVGFSVAEWAALAFVVALVAYVGRGARRLVRAHGGRSRRWQAYRLATGLIGIVGAVWLAFMLLCGLNYYRHTFAEDAGFDVRPSSTEELIALCDELAAEADERRAQLGGVDPGAYAASRGGFEAYARRAVEAVGALADDYPVLARPLYSPPKPVLASELMSYADIAGMFFPWTVESNVNVDPPFHAQPATMAHELAHQCGFMREDEANFIAYLACGRSDDELVRYSGTMLALDYALGALAREDPQAAAAVREGLSEEVRADRRASAAFWAAYEGPVAQVSHAANNAYLRANDQSDGTRSYGRMVDLLLAERRGRAQG